jgi:hypothetical protein
MYGSTNNAIEAQWVRMRLTPPNGVMPSYTLSQITTTAHTNPIIFPSGQAMYICAAAQGAPSNGITDGLSGLVDFPLLQQESAVSHFTTGNNCTYGTSGNGAVAIAGVALSTASILTPIIQQPSIQEPINYLFYAMFAIGATFTILLLITIGEDMKTLSNRPFFLITLALAGWVISLPALLSPATTTLAIGQITVSTPTSSNILIVAAHNASSTLNSPLPKGSFWAYEILWFAVVMVLFIILIYYIALKRATQYLKLDMIDEI